jgi:hypothetical protein
MASNQSIDRHDPQVAAGVFRELVPTQAAVEVARLLTRVVRAAHQLAPASWTVNLFAHKIRVNVGQVEICTLRQDTCKLITSVPSSIPELDGLMFRHGEAPVHPSVPIPSGVASFNLKVCRRIPDDLLTALDSYVAEAASRKRGSPFRQAFSPGVMLFLERALGESLPRPSYLGSLDPTSPAAPDEVLSLPTLIEGAVRRVEVNAFERDARARRLCLDHYGRSCSVCGMSFETTYGAALAGFIHVHHLRPLSEVRAEYVVDPIADLRPVCANCHAVIHSTRPPLTIHDVRTMLARGKA